MKKRIFVGLSLGILAGSIDIAPMIFQKLPVNADLSAFSLWVIVGFLISVIELKLKGIYLGLLVSLLVLLPNLFIIGWDNPLNLLPIVTMTLILGSLIGMIYKKIVKE